MVVCHSTKVELLFKQADRCKTLRTIIKIDGEVSEAEKARSKETGIAIHSMDKVLVREPRLSVRAVYYCHRLSGESMYIIS